MKMTLKLVGISHNCAGGSRKTQNVGGTILLFIKYGTNVRFQIAVFCRLTENATEDSLANAMEGDIKREKRIQNGKGQRTRVKNKIKRRENVKNADRRKYRPERMEHATLRGTMRGR